MCTQTMRFMLRKILKNSFFCTNFLYKSLTHDFSFFVVYNNHHSTLISAANSGLVFSVGGKGVYLEEGYDGWQDRAFPAFPGEF